MYHSAKSAKDRDALRQAVLEDMGWTIYRVWSTDWFNDPRGETQKLVSFLEQLRDQKTKHTEIDDESPWGAEVEQIFDDFSSQEEPTILEAEAARLGHFQDQTETSSYEQQIADELNDVAEPVDESDFANTRQPSIAANDLILPPLMAEPEPLSRASLGESLISVEQAPPELNRSFRCQAF